MHVRAVRPAVGICILPGADVKETRPTCCSNSFYLHVRGMLRLEASCYRCFLSSGQHYKNELCPLTKHLRVENVTQAEFYATLNPD